MKGNDNIAAQSLVEYILILSLVVVAVIAALTLLGQKGIENNAEFGTQPAGTETIEAQEAE
jgi:hypothetical protein